MAQKGEEQVIEASDVGVLDLSEAEESEISPSDEAEKVADIETGKLEGVLKEQFLKLYELIKPLGDCVDHSPGSKRHHFKCGKRGFALLFYYSKKPILWLAYDDGPKTKKRLEKFTITDKGVIDADGGSISQKQILKDIRAYKKARSL